MAVTAWASSTSAYAMFINGGHPLDPSLIRRNTDADGHVVLAKPFAGMKVRGTSSAPPLDTARGFSQAEWQLLCVIADGLELERGRDSMRNGELLRARSDCDQWAADLTAAWRTAGSCGAA